MSIERKDLKIITVLLAGALLVVLSLTMLSPALPWIMKDLNVTATTVQWLTSGYALVEAIVIPLAAYFMGRFSTRKLFIGAITFFMCGSLLAAWAPSFSFLMAGRIMQAVATGLVMPMVIALILLIIPREKRGAGMGLVSLIIGFAPTLGPTLGGILVDNVGWRVLFLIIAALALLVIIVAATQLNNYQAFKRTRFDSASVVLSSVGLFCVLYGLSTFSSSENYVVTAALVAVGIVGIALFVRRQLKLESPMLKVDILKSKNFAVNVVVVMLIQAGLVGMSVILPLFIQGVLNQSATVSGLTLLPGALLGALAGLVAGRLFDKHGVRPVALFGGLVMTCGALALTLLPIDVSVLLVAVAYVLISLGMQCTMTAMNTWGMNSLDNKVIQHGTSLSNCLNQVAGSFGTALLVSLSALSAHLVPGASALETAYFGNHLSFIGMATLFVIALIGIIVFASDKRRTKNVSEPTVVVTEASKDLDSKARDMQQPVILVEEVMRKDAYTIAQESTIREAISVFLDTNTSGLSVVDAQNKVVGFLSDGDVMKYIGNSKYTIVDASLVLRRHNDDTAFQDRINEMLDLGVMTIATEKVVSVSRTTPVDDACHILAERRIKKLPVVDEGYLVGSLSRGDVIRRTMSTVA